MQKIIKYPETICPACKETGGVEAYSIFRAKQIGTFSLAGVQMKLPVVEEVRAHCTLCGAEGEIK